MTEGGGAYPGEYVGASSSDTTRWLTEGGGVSSQTVS